jgi:2-phosphosulfolactate phosphatase
MPEIDVCLSPELIHLHDVNGRVAVVVDILRATSCMTAGFGSGVAEIKPFADLESCRKMRDKGYLIAGERNGKKVDGFDLGNSPFDYLEAGSSGRKLAVTTTNGTVAIEKSSGADHVIIGSFLNLEAVAHWVKEAAQDVLIVCAGWKGKVNLEDTLFAGALVDRLYPAFTLGCDAPLVALHCYQGMQDNLLDHVMASSHAQRLKRLDIEKDISYCLQQDLFEVVPRLTNGSLVNVLSR